MFVASVVKNIDACVLEKAIDDAPNTDGLALPLESGYETTDASDDQFLVDSGAAGLIEFVNHLLVFQRVHLCHDSAFASFGHRRYLCINERIEALS